MNALKLELENKRKKLIKDKDDFSTKKTNLSDDIKKIKYEHDLKEKKL